VPFSIPQSSPLANYLAYKDEIDAALKRVPLANDDRFTLPRESDAVTHVYHQYVIRTPARDDSRNFLQQHGIGTSVHYPLPVHLQPAYNGRVQIDRPLSETETAVGKSSVCPFSLR
jgi:dTDP-4-amino-4,6-dideoxygalactose transaminase